MLGMPNLNRPLSTDDLVMPMRNFQDRGRAERVGHAAGDLLVDDVDIAVAGIVAQRQRDCGVVGLVVTRGGCSGRSR